MKGTMINVNCEEECKLYRLAAFVDGEGTIGIRRQLKTSNKYGYIQQLSLSNTGVNLIDWLVENFGGKIPVARKRDGNRKDIYIWVLSGSKSYKLIKKIRPYLLLKQEQADNAILLWDKVNKWKFTKRGIPEYLRKLAEELYQRNKELNMRGKSNNDDDTELELEPKLVRRKTITLEDFE